MASLRAQILDALEMKIAGAAGVAGFVRNPDRDPQVEELPLIAMHDGGEGPPIRSTGAIEAELSITVEIYVDEAAGMTREQRLDQFYAAIYQAILVDQALGGLADDIRRGDLSDPEFNRDEGHQPYAAIAVEFLVRYTTNEIDISIRA